MKTNNARRAEAVVDLYAAHVEAVAARLPAGRWWRRTSTDGSQGLVLGSRSGVVSDSSASGGDDLQ